MSIKQANIPYCNLRQSVDRAGISADRADHTDLRGVNLRESARSVGDMFGGGSSVVFDGAKIRFFRVNICPGF